MSDLELIRNDMQNLVSDDRMAHRLVTCDAFETCGKIIVLDVRGDGTDAL